MNNNCKNIWNKKMSEASEIQKTIQWLKRMEKVEILFSHKKIIKTNTRWLGDLQYYWVKSKRLKSVKVLKLHPFLEDIKSNGHDDLWKLVMKGVSLKKTNHEHYWSHQCSIGKWCRIGFQSNANTIRSIEMFDWPRRFH